MNPEPRAKIKFWWKYQEKTGIWESTYENSCLWWRTDWFPEGEWSMFWWDEGNGACDCNRGQYFLGDYDMKCGKEIEIVDYEIVPETPYDPNL